MDHHREEALLSTKKELAEAQHDLRKACTCLWLAGGVSGSMHTVLVRMGVVDVF